MQSTFQNRPIRAMILIGFLLALMAVATMGYLAYVNVNGLAGTLRKSVESDKYLIALKNVLGELLNAESSVRTFTITRNSKDPLPYYVAIASIDQKIDTLESLTPDYPHQRQRMDSLQQLIDQKFEVLDTLISVVDDGTVQNAFEKLAAKITEAAQDVVVESLKEELPETDTPGEDSTEVLPVKKKKRGIFKRIFGRKKKESDTAKDSVIVAEGGGMEVSQDSVNKTGVVLSTLQSRALDLEKESELQAQLQQQEILRLTEKDKDIMNRIRGTIRAMEYEQTVASRESAYNANVLAKETTQFIGIFSLLVLILCLILVIIIFKDMARNQRLQENLVMEKARAEKLARAKEEFLANMSHEIRTPMNAVMGFAEQLADTPLNPQQESFLGPIRNSAQFLLALLNDVLDYSKLESGNFQLEQIGFRPAAILEEVISTFSHSARKKEISLIADPTPNLPEIVLGDPLRLRQMLFNLVSNAIKFTNEGSVTLREKSPTWEGEHIQLIYVVEDTGIGISADQLDRIFSDFMQADSSTTRKYGGSGLGLSITRKLAEMHGGNIELKSKEGKGTTAILTLSFKVGSEADLEPQKPDETVVARSLEGKRALLADDEPYNRALVQTIMAKWGVVVDPVENGRMVIEKLKDHTYDFVLMDLQMPEMDGIETTMYIRQHINEVLPILALTATSTRQDIKRALEAGMNGHLLKPFREQELYRKIAGMLGTASASPPETKAEPVVPKPEYNFDALYHLANQDKDFMHNMLNIFVSSTGVNLKEMVGAVSGKDWETVSMCAHKIIPPCRHLGLDSIVDQLKYIEIHAQERSALEEIPSAVQQVETNIQGVIESIRKEMTQLQ